jgi:3-dehydrosphinganine reductase
MAFSSAFQVHGRTAIITGGSRGMGLAVARQLAEKGANVVIVARDENRLLHGVEYVKSGALNPDIQRFHQISADLTSSSEAIRVVDEVVSWNSGCPPDIVSHSEVVLKNHFPSQYRFYHKMLLLSFR